MSRLHYNLVRTALDGAIDDTVTTFAITAPLREGGNLGSLIPTVGAGDVLAIRVDDEIMHVTAYTSGSTTITTVARGQDDTVADSHADAAVLKHVIAKDDLLQSGAGAPGKSADDIPASAGSIDYEFEAETSSLPSGWSWLNQGAATYTEGQGAGRVRMAGVGSNQFRGIHRAIPVAGTWTVDARLPGRTWMPAASADGGAFGLFLTDGTKAYGFYQKQNGGIYVEYWSAGGTFGSNIATDTRYSTPYVFPYMRIRRNSSTSYDYQVSGDGREWFSVLSANDPTANMTPTDIGVGGFVGSTLGASDVVVAACDWLRQTA